MHKARPIKVGKKWRIEVEKSGSWIQIGKSNGIFLDYTELDNENEALEYIEKSKEMELAIPTLGERIKAFRKSKGFTNSELAEYFGISYSSLSNWINSRFSPDAENLEKINKAMGIDIIDVVELLERLKSTKGMNNVELSKFLDVPLQTLRQWLSGKVKPSYYHIGKLEDVFKLEGVL